MSINLIVVEGMIRRVTPFRNGEGAWFKVEVITGKKDPETGLWNNKRIYPKDFKVPPWDWKNPERRKLFASGAMVVVSGKFDSYIEEDEDGREKTHTIHIAENVAFKREYDKDIDIEALRMRRSDFIAKVKEETDGNNNHKLEGKAEG